MNYVPLLKVTCSPILFINGNIMNADFLRYRGLLTVAVGAGVVIGAAGIFLYQQLNAKRRRRRMLQSHLARIDLTVSEMRTELDALRKLSRSRQTTGVTQRNNSKSVSTLNSDVDSDIDMYTTIGTDGGDDEFFDLSDEDDLLILHNETDEFQENESDSRLLQLFSNVDQLLKGATDEKKAAYNLLLEHETQFPSNVGLLWRLAKANHTLATICDVSGDLEKKKEYVLQGCNFAQQALEVDDSNSEAHKWFAILVGSRGQFLGFREKIEDGFAFKEHLEKALILQPNDPSLHHLLGRFKYEVAALSWLERKLACTLFAELPEATHLEALEDCFQAEKLSNAPWKENRLLVAKCYASQGEMVQAVDWLDRAANVPIVTPEDEAAEREVQGLLMKYGSYRSTC